MKTINATGEQGTALEPYGPTVLAALAVAGALVLALAGWGLFGRLDAAIVAGGVIEPSGERQTVEHLEGGILAEILVRPGDRVAAGAAVARLDDTQIQEQLAQFEALRRRHLMTIWRLTAARDGLAPDPARAPGADASIPETDRGRLVAEEIALWRARAQAHAARIDALERRIEQLRGQIAAYRGQAEAAATQVGLWQQERAMIATLVARGASPRQRLLDLDRAVASLSGQHTENAGLARASTEEIEAARAEIRALRQQRQAEILAELSQISAALDQLDSQIRAARDVRARHVLRAPAAGFVVDVATLTPGAVIASGQPLMDILPEDAGLIAMLRLAPSTIDTLRVGRSAKVRLTAYKRANAPIVDGKVSYVSADVIRDAASGEAFFEAHVEIDPADVADLPSAEVLAGMPVEVMIAIGERRAAEYLAEPFLRHLRRAFREE